MSVKEDTRPRDRRGWLRSSATMPGAGKGRAPATKGRKYEPHPFTVVDMGRLLAACTPQRPGRAAELSALRLSTMAIVMYRTGARVSEMLALEPRDLNRDERKVVIRHGKGDKRRVVRMDDWGWDHLMPWLVVRQAEMPSPYGAVFCVISGPTAGWQMLDSDVRRQLAEASVRAKLGRRANPHSFRHSFAIELKREGLDIYAINHALGHSSLDVTAAYLRSLGDDEIMEPIARRGPPMVPLA